MLSSQRKLRLSVISFNSVKELESLKCVVSMTTLLKGLCDFVLLIMNTKLTIKHAV